MKNQVNKRQTRKPQSQSIDVNDSLLKLREALVLSLNYISVAASNLDLCIDLIDVIVENPTKGKRN